MWTADDVPALFQDFGLVVEAEDGTTTRGILDMEDIVETDVAGTQLMTRDTVLRIETAGLSAAVTAVGKDVTYDGSTVYRIRDRRVEGDGAVTVLTVVTV